MIIAILFVALGGMSLVLAINLAAKLRANLQAPSPEAVALSAVANFFDALGVGSFAPTTVYLRLRGRTPDHLIPPTMIVGYAFAVVAEAFIFLTAIPVDAWLLASCVGASILGAGFGAALAGRLPTRLVRLAMGVGLILAGALFAASNLGWIPAGGTARSLTAAPLAAAVCVSAGLGVLSNVGIGNFGPMLITFGLLGLDPRAAFPVMMSSAAFMLLAGGIEITRKRTLDPGLVLGLIFGGIPGVLVAAYVVKALPLQALRWGVVAVAAYAGVVMLVQGLRRGGTSAAQPGREDSDQSQTAAGAGEPLDANCGRTPYRVSLAIAGRSKRPSLRAKAELLAPGGDQA